jgi:hypothetical protein
LFHLIFSLNLGVKLTDVEKQFIAEEYDVLMGTFKDYGMCLDSFLLVHMFLLR